MPLIKYRSANPHEPLRVFHIKKMGKQAQRYRTCLPIFLMCCVALIAWTDKTLNWEVN